MHMPRDPDAPTGTQLPAVVQRHACAYRDLFEMTNLLRGWRLSSKGPVPAFKRMWRWHPQVLNFAVKNEATLEATLCKTVAAADSVVSGFTGAEGDATAGVPSGSWSSSEESEARTEAKSQEVTQWLFPRAVLWPQPSLELSPAFLADLEAAVRDPDDEALVKVLQV